MPTEKQIENVLRDNGLANVAIAEPAHQDVLGALCHFGAAGDTFTDYTVELHNLVDQYQTWEDIKRDQTRWYIETTPSRKPTKYVPDPTTQPPLIWKVESIVPIPQTPTTTPPPPIPDPAIAEFESLHEIWERDTAENGTFVNKLCGEVKALDSKKVLAITSQKAKDEFERIEAVVAPKQINHWFWSIMKNHNTEPVTNETLWETGHFYTKIAPNNVPTPAFKAACADSDGTKLTEYIDTVDTFMTSMENYAQYFPTLFTDQPATDYDLLTTHQILSGLNTVGHTVTKDLCSYTQNPNWNLEMGAYTRNLETDGHSHDHDHDHSHEGAHTNAMGAQQPADQYVFDMEALSTITNADMNAAVIDSAWHELLVDFQNANHVSEETFWAFTVMEENALSSFQSEMVYMANPAQVIAFGQDYATAQAQCEDARTTIHVTNFDYAAMFDDYTMNTVKGKNSFSDFASKDIEMQRDLHECLVHHDKHEAMHAGHHEHHEGHDHRKLDEIDFPTTRKRESRDMHWHLINNPNVVCNILDTADGFTEITRRQFIMMSFLCRDQFEAVLGKLDNIQNESVERSQIKAICTEMVHGWGPRRKRLGDLAYWDHTAEPYRWFPCVEYGIAEIRKDWGMISYTNCNTFSRLKSAHGLANYAAALKKDTRNKAMDMVKMNGMMKHLYGASYVPSESRLVTVSFKDGKMETQLVYGLSMTFEGEVNDTEAFQTALQREITLDYQRK